MLLKRLLFFFTLLSFFTLASAVKAEAAGCTKPRNNIVITKNTTFCSGTYNIEDSDNNGIIQVKSSNITLEGSNLILNGKEFNGYGIVLNGNSNVTIRNMSISNYNYALKLENTSGLLVENNNLSNNKKETTGFLNINTPIGSAYGGGILLNNISNSTIRNNTLKNQNTGIDTYVGSNNIFSGNDASENSAWGIRLYQSTFNTIENNQLHHVNRCNNTGCDSSGILLVYGSHNNTIRGNNLTYSGNGFFIGNEYGQPSNDNLIENNDGSFSPNNSFEATFSTGNIFRNNTASNSNYGFWLGFSYSTRVENNIIQNNQTDGIHWEHGRYGTIQSNQFLNNTRYGLALTLNPNNTVLMEKYPGSEASHHYTITDNTAQDNARGIEFSYTTDSTISNNRISGNNVNVYFEDNTTVSIGSSSAVLGNTSIGANEWTPGDRKIMARYSLSSNNTATGMSMYGRWDGGGATGNKGFIYADNGGVPGTLVGVTEIKNINSSVSQWWTFTFSSPIPLQAGDYWIGILMQEPGTYINYNPGSANQSAFDTTAEAFDTGPEDPASAVRLESKNPSIFLFLENNDPNDPPPTFVDSNNAVSQNNIICTSITGNTCQFNTYNNTGKSVDMKNNWWGTIDSLIISQLLFDHVDDRTRGPIYFEPFLTSQL